MQCKFTSVSQGVDHTFARYFNRTHVGCPIPTYSTEESVLVDLTFDRQVTYSASPVVIELIPAPEIIRLNNTEYYYTHHEQVYIELTGRYLSKGMYLYVRVGDQVQKINEITEVDSEEDGLIDVIVFLMPIQLDLGSYPITVSTDGMNYRPDDDASIADQFFVTIVKCPDGYTCEQETPVICPPGYFCPHGEPQMFQPRQCPIGTYMTGTGADSCDECSEDKYCPKIRLVFEEACPKGFMCPETGSHTLRQIMECPAGYVCGDGTESFSNLDLFADGNMRPCPDGHYCPKGTMQERHLYGNFTTPQICKDGTICAQSNTIEKLEN